MKNVKLVSLSLTLIVVGCSSPPDDTANTDTGSVGTHSDWSSVQRAIARTDGNASTPAVKPQASPLNNARPIAELVTGLEARVAAEPNNLGHRELLVQTYAFLGRKQDAEQALTEAVAIGGDEVQLRAGLDRILQQHRQQPW